MPNAYNNQAGRPKPSNGGMAVGMPVNTALGPGRIMAIQRGANTMFSSPFDPFLITILITSTQQTIQIPVSAQAFGSYNAGASIGGASLL